MMPTKLDLAVFFLVVPWTLYYRSIGNTFLQRNICRNFSQTILILPYVLSRFTSYLFDKFDCFFMFEKRVLYFRSLSFISRSQNHGSHYYASPIMEGTSYIVASYK
jgi:hypothetical protein